MAKSWTYGERGALEFGRDEQRVGPEELQHRRPFGRAVAEHGATVDVRSELGERGDPQLTLVIVGHDHAGLPIERRRPVVGTAAHLAVGEVEDHAVAAVIARGRRWAGELLVDHLQREVEPAASAVQGTLLAEHGDSRLEGAEVGRPGQLEAGLGVEADQREMGTGELGRQLDDVGPHAVESRCVDAVVERGHAARRIDDEEHVGRCPAGLAGCAADRWVDGDHRGENDHRHPPGPAPPTARLDEPGRQ